MTKRIITLLILTVIILSALSGCAVSPEKIDLHTTEGSGAESDAPTLHSFFGREASFDQDPYDNYLCFLPEEGSEELELWGRIYAEQPEEGVTVYQNDGEVYEILYVGEIEKMKDSEYGFIKELHSFRIKSSPREYGGVNYGVAFMSDYFDREKVLASGKSHMLVKDRSELESLFNDYFLFKREAPADATEMAKKSVAALNNRTSLLDGYDSEFFNNHDLFLIFQGAGSGSIRYDVTDVKIESGVCTVTYEEIAPPGTADLEYWIIFISIPKEISAQITEYKTYMPTAEWYQ